MTDIGTLWIALGVALAGWCAGILLRCRLGFHQQPMLMERAQDTKGRDDPYTVNWRCPRCMQLSKSTTSLPPRLALKAQIHRDRKMARILEMRRRA